MMTTLLLAVHLAAVDPPKPAANPTPNLLVELMGVKCVRNDYASWGEWGNADDTPVALPAQEVMAGNIGRLGESCGR